MTKIRPQSTKLPGKAGSGTDHHIVRWDGVDALQDSPLVIDDDGKTYASANSSSYFYAGSAWSFISGGHYTVTIGGNAGSRTFILLNSDSSNAFQVYDDGKVRMYHQLSFWGTSPWNIYMGRGTGRDGRIHANDADAENIFLEGGVGISINGAAFTVNTEMSMATHKITNVVDPAADQDAATKKYADDEDAAADAHISATGASHSYINQDVTTTGTPTFGITTLGDSSQLATSAAPTDDADIANKKYHDDNIYTVPTGTDNRLVRMDGTNEIQDSGIDVDDSDNLSGPQARMSAFGGLDIQIINKTGANSVLGNVVEADPANASSFILTVANSLSAIGVVAEAGIADASACWVTVTGLAIVLMSAAVVPGDRIVTAGGLIPGLGVANNAPAVAVHFQEIGHAITGTGGMPGPATCVVHFL